MDMTVSGSPPQEESTTATCTSVDMGNLSTEPVSKTTLIVKLTTLLPSQTREITTRLNVLYTTINITSKSLK